MLDLEYQLRRYADEVERRYPDIAVDEIVGELRHTARLRRLPMPTQGTVIAVAAALVVLVLVGGVALFSRVIGTGPAPVVTGPEGAPTTAPVESSSPWEIDGRQMFDTPLGTWVWTYVGEGWEVGRPLLGLDGLSDPAPPDSALADVPLPQVDEIDWWPRHYDKSTARFGEVEVTIIPVEGQVDWSKFYAHDSGWVEGRYGPFPYGRGGWTILTAGRHIELPATLEIVAEEVLLATLEVSLIPGDPDVVEYRDRDTGEIVLRLDATEPELSVEQLVRAGHSCGFFGCAVTVWRLLTDGAETVWVDPPWLGLRVDHLAITAGTTGFVIAAVENSSTSPMLHIWGSSDGRAWDTLGTPHPIEIPAGAEVIGLQLVGGGGLMQAVMNVGGAGRRHLSLIWASTDGAEWLPVDIGVRLEVEQVGLTPHGWVMVGHRPVGIGPGCEVWVSVDGVTWEQVALPLGDADMSQCHLVGDTVVLRIEQIQDWEAYAAGEVVDSLEHWWRGEFDG